ncbi:PulJ/GspJ family protein [Desulfamplus magnetovallimortis]|nr:type II secretion system protein [Desulfamplus magnetovallimortis]
MKKNKNKKGFTLLEIMVAILIFGTLMMTIFSSFRSFAVSNQIIKQHIAKSEKGDLISDRITKDLTALRIALPPEYSKPDEINSYSPPLTPYASS